MTIERPYGEFCMAAADGLDKFKELKIDRVAEPISKKWKLSSRELRFLKGERRFSFYYLLIMDLHDKN